MQKFNYLKKLRSHLKMRRFKAMAQRFPQTLSKIDSDIQGVGLSVVTVSDGTYRQAFAYSIGLTAKYAHPELIISGLPPSVAATLINDCARDLAADRQYTDRTQLDDLLSGSNRCVVRKVTDECKQDLFGFAFAYYGHANFEAVQIIWPDRAGRLPGEPYYEQGADLQDFFFEPGDASSTIYRT